MMLHTQFTHTVIMDNPGQYDTFRPTVPGYLERLSIDIFCEFTEECF